MRIALFALVAAVATNARAGSFTEADLDAMLASSPVSHRPVESIAELVPLLPASLRQSFTFVHDSRSPFKSSISLEHPRVVLFLPDATFIATFTGDPEKPGHDVLETMTFDRTTRRFTLRARVLPAARREGVDDVPSASCARCHGEDARPIFDSYPLWPGFYGSAQDTFPPELESGRKEREGYRRFLTSEARRGVYKGLLWVSGSPVSPYLPPERAGGVEADPDDGLLFYQPNTRLGMALTELNRARIFRKLAAAPHFQERERTLLSELLGCDDGGVLSSERKILTAARAENAARLVRLGVDPERTIDPRFQMQELLEPTNLARLDRLAHHAGVDRADWSMALEPYSASFFDGILSQKRERHSRYLTEDLILELLGDLAKRDASLRAQLDIRPSFPSLGLPFGNKLDLVKAEASCSKLRRSSHARRAAR